MNPIAAPRRVARAVLLTLIATAALAAPRTAHAQDALDRVQNLIATGRFTEARSTLEQWETAHGDPRSNARPADRARALFLRGTLSTDAREAEDAYLSVVLSHPSSGVAPEALLRLGQGSLTAGDPRRAVGYFERLRNDYPGAAQQQTAWLWLARAQHAAGAAAAACSTARNGAAEVTDMNMRMLLELERDRTCVDGAQTADSPFAAPTRAAAPQQQTAAPAQTAAAAFDGEFAVQTGAYREYSSANNVANQMRARGFDVRVVLVGDSPLHRVRFGAFATNAEASAAARAIRDAGFATIIVSDVQLERR
jgi:cell division septation protein DedD